MRLETNNAGHEQQVNVKLNLEIESEDIRERLLALCRKQLARARLDAGSHFEILTARGIAIAEQLDSVFESTDSAHTLANSADSARLKDLVGALIMEFQFFDEFSQRMEHIESTISGCQNDLFQEEKPTLDNLASIFSTRSEQDEFYSIFPEMAKYASSGEASTISSVELF